jgi:hypothetical protein
VFRINEARSADGRITVAEMQPPYSVTDGCAAASGAAGMGLLADADGCVQYILAFAVIACVLAPIFVLNITEKGFRKLLESEVRADLAEVADPYGTVVNVRLRGISAILMKSAYAEALSEPRLPEDIAIASGVQPPPAPRTPGAGSE